MFEVYTKFEIDFLNVCKDYNEALFIATFSKDWSGNLIFNPTSPKENLPFYFKILFSLFYPSVERKTINLDEQVERISLACCPLSGCPLRPIRHSSIIWRARKCHLMLAGPRTLLINSVSMEEVYSIVGV